jgi:hypothetical protein
MLEENEQRPTTQQCNPFDASSHPTGSPADPSIDFSVPRPRTFPYISPSAYYQSGWIISYYLTCPTGYPIVAHEFKTAVLIKYQFCVHCRSTIICCTHTLKLCLSQKWITHLRGELETGLKLTLKTSNPPRQLTSFGQTVCVTGLRESPSPKQQQRNGHRCCKG